MQLDKDFLNGGWKTHQLTHYGKPKPRSPHPTSQAGEDVEMCMYWPHPASSKGKPNLSCHKRTPPR